jgi:hypothetical protein
MATGQATSQPTSSVGIVDSGQQNATSDAASQTPSILGTTPATGQSRIWERHRFFDVWDIGYPPGWTVERPGTGEIALTGAYGAHRYRVEVARPEGVQAKNLADWVKSDLEAMDQGGAPRQEAKVKDLPAMKVSNLKLPGQAEGACPAVRVYGMTDKLTGEQNYIVMSFTQADQGPCDAGNLERLADAFIAEVRS